MEEWWSKLSNECLKLDSAIEAFSKAQKKLLSLKERLIREEIVLEEKGKVCNALFCVILSLACTLLSTLLVLSPLLELCPVASSNWSRHSHS